MISFVWLSKHPFLAGAGGTENYTAGQIKELRRRGVDAQIVTIGLGTQDGREYFPDIPFISLKSVDEVSKLSGKIIYIIYPQTVPTKQSAHVILHCPLSLCDQDNSLFDKNIGNLGLLTPSKFAASLWGEHFERPQEDIPVIYPFAEDCFGGVQRKKRASNNIRILFAGRLTPDKGIYTLLAALHLQLLQDKRFEFTVTTAGTHAAEGRLIHALLKAHPLINIVEARKTPQAMAKLFAEFDIVVMPTTALFWAETFGIVSVEAQHAGCRVVASSSGGLPETDCGSLTLIEPDNPLALAKGIREAITLGPVTPAQRTKAAQHFTVRQSVDTLLQALYPHARKLHPHIRMATS